MPHALLNLQRNLKPLMTGLFTLILTAACSRPAPTTSHVDSVDLPQSAVKDQGRAGFCWAYATVGYIEQFHLNQSGQEVDLSEEALAFHLIVDQLMSQARSVALGALKVESITEAKLFDEGYNLKADANDETGAFGILRQHGVVPETEWSIKFSTDEQLKAFRASIFQAFKTYVATAKLEDITPEAIAREVMVGQDRFPSAPPTRLANGSTPVDYLQKGLNFNPDDYEALYFYKEADYDLMVSLVKQALYRKLPVPFTFQVDNKLRGKDFTFTGNPTKPLPENYVFTRDAGHVVIVTDWVNLNDKPGALPPAELEKSLQAPTEALDYVAIKNSWGTSFVPLTLPKGYFKIDQAYMRRSLKSGNGFSVLLPKGLSYNINPNAFADRDPAFHPWNKGLVILNKLDSQLTIHTPASYSGALLGCKLNIGSEFSMDLDVKAMMMDLPLANLQAREIGILEAAAGNPALAAQTVYTTCASNAGDKYLKFLMTVIN